MTNQNEFDAPGRGDRIDWNDHIGDLLMFTVHSLEEGISTTARPGELSTAIKCDVAVIGGNGATYENTLVFPKILQQVLTPKPGVEWGRRVLGRLTQGTAQPGKNAPWLLADPDDTDYAAASAYRAKVAE